MSERRSLSHTFLTLGNDPNQAARVTASNRPGRAGRMRSLIEAVREGDRAAAAAVQVCPTAHARRLYHSVFARAQPASYQARHAIADTRDQELISLLSSPPVCAAKRVCANWRNFSLTCSRALLQSEVDNVEVAVPVAVQGGNVVGAAPVGESGVRDAAAAAAGADSGADAAAGGRQQPAPPSSRWRAFFKDCGNNVFECLLAPSSAGSQMHPKTISISGGPSNLGRHLESQWHKKEYEEFVRLTGPPASMAPESAAALIIEEQNKKAADGGAIGKAFRTAKRMSGAADENLTEALIRELSFVCFLIKNGLSFNCIEDRHLAQFVGQASQKALPKRHRVSDVLLPLMFEIVCDQRREKIKHIDFFSITCDAWTSIAMDSYLSLTVHFVNREWELESFLLDLISLPVSHTWLNMAHVVALRLLQLLPESATLVATVTDNGCNFLCCCVGRFVQSEHCSSNMPPMAAALHLNLEALGVDGVTPADLDLAHNETPKTDDLTALWRCVAHRAQLAVDDILGADGVDSDVKALIVKIRTVCKKFSSSALLSGKLRKVQMDLKHKELKVGMCLFAVVILFAI